MPISDVAAIVRYGVHRRFDNPASIGVPPAGDDDDYSVPIEDSFLDLLRIHFPEIGDDPVLLAIDDAVDNDGHPWASIDWSERFPDDRLLDGWDLFTETIANRGRFLSVLLEPDFDFRQPPDPQQLLTLIGEMAEQAGRIVTLPKGSQLWRARVSGQPQPTWAAADLGTPPAAFARGSNRMSPVGLPLFYGAAEQDTAIDETVYRSRGGEWVMAGSFTLETDVQILDLSEISAPPSLFDRSSQAAYYPLRFLQQWASRLAFPARDNWSTIDYIPTQVATEYFLRLFHGGGQIRGIRYESVQRPGSSCVALDIPNAYCVNSAEELPVPDMTVPPPQYPAPSLTFDPASATQRQLRIVAT